MQRRNQKLVRNGVSGVPALGAVKDPALSVLWQGNFWLGNFYMPKACERKERKEGRKINQHNPADV